MRTDKKLLYMCHAALGTALYFVVSMTIKIPVIGHISLDLGYIVLAIYCYLFGGAYGAFIGGAGCILVSIISSGWIPYGWFPGNLVIGYICGRFYIRKKSLLAFTKNVGITLIAVFIGIVCIKTFVEVLLFQIPLSVKLAKDIVAFVMDTIVMSAGLALVQMANRKA